MVDPTQYSSRGALPIRPVGEPQRVAPPSPPTGDVSFSDVLRAAIKEVDSLQHRADTLKESLVLDPNADLQEVMVATEQARLAFEFTMQVRNKVVQAYEELMRLQI